MSLQVGAGTWQHTDLHHTSVVLSAVTADTMLPWQCFNYFRHVQLAARWV